MFRFRVRVCNTVTAIPSPVPSRIYSYSTTRVCVCVVCRGRPVSCRCCLGSLPPSRLVFLFYNSSRGRVRPSPFVLSYGRSSYYNIVLVCLFVVDCCVVPCRHHRCRRRRRHRSVPIFFLFVRFIVITVATTATTVPISATIYCRYRCPNIIIVVDPPVGFSLPKRTPYLSESEWHLFATANICPAPSLLLLLLLFVVPNVVLVLLLLFHRIFDGILYRAFVVVGVSFIHPWLL